MWLEHCGRSSPEMGEKLPVKCKQEENMPVPVVTPQRQGNAVPFHNHLFLLRVGFAVCPAQAWRWQLRQAGLSPWGHFAHHGVSLSLDLSPLRQAASQLKLSPSAPRSHSAITYPSV